MSNDPSNFVVFFSIQALKCKKCIEIAPIIVLFYIQIGNVPNLYVTKYNDWCNFAAILCVSGPEMHEKCNEISPITVLCYIKIGRFPKLYVTKYKDLCNFAAFLCASGPEMHKKCNKIAPIIVLYHK